MLQKLQHQQLARETQGEEIDFEQFRRPQEWAAWFIVSLNGLLRCGVNIFCLFVPLTDLRNGCGVYEFCGGFCSIRVVRDIDEQHLV